METYKHMNKHVRLDMKTHMFMSRKTLACITNTAPFLMSLGIYINFVDAVILRRDIDRGSKVRPHSVETWLWLS